MGIDPRGVPDAHQRVLEILPQAMRRDRLEPSPAVKVVSNEVEGELSGFWIEGDRHDLTGRFLPSARERMILGVFLGSAGELLRSRALHS